jgi:membrane-anchored glycerophosphoryl diester phosphodiesterase (GDPDase)
MFGEDLLITIYGIIIIVLIALIFALPIIITEHKIRKRKKQNPNYTDLDAFNEFFR